MILVTRVNNKLENKMDPSKYEVIITQIEFFGMKISNKINVSKSNKEVVYTSFIKQERVIIQL